MYDLPSVTGFGLGLLIMLLIVVAVLGWFVIEAAAQALQKFERRKARAEVKAASGQPAAVETMTLAVNVDTSQATSALGELSTAVQGISGYFADPLEQAIDQAVRLLNEAPAEPECHAPGLCELLFGHLEALLALQLCQLSERSAQVEPMPTITRL